MKIIIFTLVALLSSINFSSAQQYGSGGDSEQAKLESMAKQAGLILNVSPQGDEATFMILAIECLTQLKLSPNAKESQIADIILPLEN